MKREPALDGLRGFAIIWVLSFHLLGLPARAAGLHLPRALESFALNGWMGVDIFFALSGFLITRGLVGQPRDRGYFTSFIARRAFRIIPCYALLLASFPLARALWPASSSGAEAAFNTSIPIWSYAAFSQNFYMARLGTFGNDWLRVLWSLAVEVQFYAFICVSIYVIPRRQLVVWLCALVIGSAAFRYLVYFTQDNPDVALVVLLPGRLDVFVLGGLVALAPRRVPNVRRACWGLCILAAVWWGLRLYSSGDLGAWTRYAFPLYNTMIAVSCAAAVDLCAGPVGPTSRIMGSAPLAEAGKLSYFIYLFHMPVTLTVFQVIFKGAPSLGSLGLDVAMAAAAAVVFVLAKLSYDHFEEPLIRISHSIARRPLKVSA